MQLKRTIVVTAVIAAVVAPSAAARPADPQGVPKPAAESVSGGSGFADIATHREAISNQHWQLQADGTVAAPVTALARSQDDAFDWGSALIGAAIPLTLLLVDLLGRLVLNRRRIRTSAIV